MDAVETHGKATPRACGEDPAPEEDPWIRRQRARKFILSLSDPMQYVTK